MFARQRGATFLGMLTIVAILGFGLYAGIRLLPLYLEYMAIARALEQIATENNNNPTSPHDSCAGSSPAYRRSAIPACPRR